MTPPDDPTPEPTANDAAPAPKTPEELGWPAGYFESTFGSITDPAFVAPPRYPAKPLPPLDLD